MPRFSSKKFEEAKRLQDLRALLNVSQRELAEHFGVAHGAIAHWENGKRTIPGPVLRLMDIYEENLGMIERPVRKEGIRKLNSSWATRTWKTSVTAAQITARLGKSSLYQLVSGNERAAQIKAATQDAIAAQVTESLGELKGLLMKMGQIMSYMDFALPESARVLLATLQDSTKPMEPGVAESVIERELGAHPRDLFKKWDPNPIAAASIGQVHAATLKDGTEVVVKVQYPEITRTLESDLANTAIFDRLGTMMFRNQDRGAFLNELRERLLEECDYENEAKNLKLFRRLYKDCSWAVIPSVFDEYSSKRVLTMERIKGKRFGEFVKTASLAERSKAAEFINTMAFRSIFTHHVFNCDPHPGNYLFLADGRVAFLDFGCVKHFDKDFVRVWKKYQRSLLEGNRESHDKLALQMGFAPRPDRFDFAYHYRMMRHVYRPWLTEGKFKITRDFVRDTWRLLVTDNPNKYQANMPQDWVFLNRLQWGLYSVLADLDAAFDARSIQLDLIYEPGEKRPAAPAPEDWT